MEVDAYMALIRMSDGDDQIVANLAKVTLGLAESIREAEARAELAEATLEAERARFTDMLQIAQDRRDQGLPRPSRSKAA